VFGSLSQKIYIEVLEQKKEKQSGPCIIHGVDPGAQELAHRPLGARPSQEVARRSSPEPETAAGARQVVARRPP
jgi:hypothetical protein